MNAAANLAQPVLRGVVTDGAPTPRGHYSQAIVAAGMVHVCGLLPVDPESGRIVGADGAAQIARVLRSLDAVLRAAGSEAGRVVSLQVFLCDSALWPVVNQACADYFGDHRPARTVVPISPLRDGALIELNAIALA